MKMKPFGKPLARNLLVATSLLPAGSVPMVTHSQTQTPASPSAADKPQQSRAQQLMGDIAPKMAELTDGVLFGDIWERPQLSKRDRSLATVSALIALNRPDQLRSHLALARQNGVTEEGHCQNNCKAPTLAKNVERLCGTELAPLGESGGSV